MPTQRQIHAFTAAFHQKAVARLVDEPALAKRAIETLDRWQAQRGPSAADAYLREWKALLAGDLGELHKTVCADDDHAATLRNTSPLGFVLTPAERQTLRNQSMS